MLVLDYYCTVLYGIDMQVLTLFDCRLCILSAAWTVFFVVALLCTCCYGAVTCSFVSISFCVCDL